jgi:hypothetical protein
MTQKKPQPIDFLHSAFDKINAFKREGHARKLFKQFVTDDFAFRSVIQGAFNKKITFMLPAGTPEGFDEIQSPGVINAKTLFTSGDIRKFVGPKGSAGPETEVKWVGWLEAVDPLDVKVLEAMKDKRFTEAYPMISRSFVVAALGELEADKLIGQ